jgi:hypothetical protein
MVWQHAKANYKPIMEKGRVDVTLGMPRAERIAEKYGTTHVVLSFGGANGGAYFARWLRWQIMQARRYTKPNNVYLDAEALRCVPETAITVMDATRSWLIGVASLNGGWHAYYRHAVAQSHTMIFVGTPDWKSSTWCRGEQRDFELENKARIRRGADPIRGIVLAMDGCHLPIPGTRALVAPKRDAELAYTARHAVGSRANPEAAAAFGVKLRQTNLPENKKWSGNFVIDSMTLLQLLQMIDRP